MQGCQGHISTDDTIRGKNTSKSPFYPPPFYVIQHIFEPFRTFQVVSHPLRLPLERNGAYFMRNIASQMVLGNQYVNNDGTGIIQEEESNYDNVSQKWSFTPENGWYLIANQSDYSKSKVLSVENATKADNANVVLFTSGKKDEQLWGLEYVYTPDNTYVASTTVEQLILYPTIIEEEFSIVGPAQDKLSVSILTLTGDLCKHFDAQSNYNISELTKGSYIVVVNGADGKQLFSKMIVKK